MSLLVLRASEISDLLPLSECVEVMDRAMRAFSSGEVTAPTRIIAPLSSEGGNEPGYFILMPGEMKSPAHYGAKIVGLHPANPARGRPAVQGFVTLFERDSGKPVALLDGASITAIRTAAASALATRELARTDAASHGIFGTGVQAAAHLNSILCVRDVNKVVVWGRDFDKAQQFAERHVRFTGLDIVAVEDPAVAAACDIVTAVTNSPQPVLRGEWLRPGAHLNLVGAHEPGDREADSDTVARASLYVDSLDGALKEAGDLLIPISEQRIRPEDITGEIGDVLLRRVAGRTSQEPITLYKSLGIVAQDLFAAEYILGEARNQGKGQLVEFP